jgi:hypothetical protein
MLSSNSNNNNEKRANPSIATKTMGKQFQIFLFNYILGSFCLASASSRVVELEHRPARSPKGLERNGRRLSASEALQACEEDAAINEDNLSDTGLECKCETVEGGVTLICVDACAYCNSDDTVCGINSAQAFYDNDTGIRTAIGGVFKYELGLKGTLAVENIGCTEDDNGRIISCQTCNVYANNHLCNSCDFKTCPDGRVEEIMDCSNIEPGAIFDFCDEVVIEEGIFRTFSDGQFNECKSLSLLESTSSKSSKKSSKKSGSIDLTSKSAKKMKSRRRT